HLFIEAFGRYAVNVGQVSVQDDFLTPNGHDASLKRQARDGRAFWLHAGDSVDVRKKDEAGISRLHCAPISLTPWLQPGARSALELKLFSTVWKAVETADCPQFPRHRAEAAVLMRWL